MPGIKKNADWGFHSNGKIYIHVNSLPSPGIQQKYYPHVEVYIKLEIPEMPINFRYVGCDGYHSTGMPTTSQWAAVPLLEWKKLK